MFRKARYLALAVLIFPLIANGDELSYAEAEEVWLKTKDSSEYLPYLKEFVQFNNHFKLDVRNDCYELGEERVSLYLSIAHPDESTFGIIESVVTKSQSGKSQCFLKTYQGLKVKAPPYEPFVLQLEFGLVTPDN